MVRPRTYSDEELMSKIGDGIQSASWSLTDAAEAAGVHPATLIKRFGSRRGVLEALSRRWIATLPIEPHGSGALAELRTWLEEHASGPQDADVAVSGLGMLMEDLQDEVLTDLLREGWSRQRTYLAALLADAADRGELTRAPEPQVGAQILLDLAHGALLWAAANTGHGAGSDIEAPWSAVLEGWT